jgi:hypothetical protein
MSLTEFSPDEYTAATLAAALILLLILAVIITRKL